MDNFLSLPKEKQKLIIDAALWVFGKNGYKKASVNDIAASAGISKAMVFYYFGNKKAMYFYLKDFCERLIFEEIEKNLTPLCTDFFDRIKQISAIKIAVMKQYPSVLVFLKSVYYETDSEVKSEVKKSYAESWPNKESLVMANADISRFKAGIEPRLVMKMLIWIGEGFASEWSAEHINDKFDGFIEEYNKCLDVMKQNFYREETP